MTVAPTFDCPLKVAALARPRISGHGEQRMMVLAGYFLVAAITVIGASAIIGLVLTNLMIRRFTKADRPIRVASASEVNEDLEQQKQPREQCLAN
jgi:hypothetical protein